MAATENAAQAAHEAIIDKASIAELVTASRLVFAAINAWPQCFGDETAAGLCKLDSELVTYLAHCGPSTAEEAAHKAAYLLARHRADDMDDNTDTLVLDALLADARQFGSIAGGTAS
jgi:hypothetical protein